MNDKIAKCLAALDGAGVKYRLAEHAHADTIDDVVALGLEDGDRIAKNLFVRDAKKINYYVLTVRQDKHVSLKEAQEKMGGGQTDICLRGRAGGAARALKGLRDSAGLYERRGQRR